MTRYVWLDINTGEFSNSWSEEDHAKYHEPTLRDLDNREEIFKGWKLIKYEVLNDENFEFYRQMKLK